VAICDVDEAWLRQTSRQLAVSGRAPVLARVFDVRNGPELEAFFAGLDEHGIVAEILVNVVGGSFQSDFLDSRPKGWQMLADLNLMHVLETSKLAATRMIGAGKTGTIINITSIEAHRAAPGYAVYAGLKSAVEGFGRSLAVELGVHGIRVNAVAPDYVVTGGTAELERRQGREPIGDAEATAIVPLARLGNLDDIAGCVVFLASGLSRFVTGSTLHPDGGALVAGRWTRTDGAWAPRLLSMASPADIAREAPGRL
jgi:3-oxoacyl-[acyl-carrier protein] reductase